MLSFFRFAACPFCNLRIPDLVSRYDELGDNFSIVALFDSSLANLQRHAERHHAPFPILADERNIYYRDYGIERSLLGTLKGAVLHLPSVLYATVVKGDFCILIPAPSLPHLSQPALHPSPIKPADYQTAIRASPSLPMLHRGLGLLPDVQLQNADHHQAQ